MSVCFCSDMGNMEFTLTLILHIQLYSPVGIVILNSVVCQYIFGTAYQTRFFRSTKQLNKNLYSSAEVAFLPYYLISSTILILVSYSVYI